MGVAERITKWLTLGTAIAWFVFAWLTVIRALMGWTLPTLEFEGVRLELTPVLPPLGVEDVGRAIVALLYAVFRWVLIAVVVIAGMQAAIGLVQQFIVTFLPISLPRGSLNTLIRTVLGLLIIKAIVDAAMKYFGYTVVELVYGADVLTLVTFLLAALISARAWLRGGGFVLG